MPTPVASMKENELVSLRVKTPDGEREVRFRLIGPPNTSGCYRRAEVISPVEFSKEIKHWRDWVRVLRTYWDDSSVRIPTDSCELYVGLLDRGEVPIFAISGSLDS